MTHPGLLLWISSTVPLRPGAEAGSEEQMAAGVELADHWWAWHDQDDDRHSATMAEADDRCAAWVAGTSDDGPTY